MQGLAQASKHEVLALVVLFKAKSHKKNKNLNCPVML